MLVSLHAVLICLSPPYLPMFFTEIPPPPRSTLFPSTTLFRSLLRFFQFITCWRCADINGGRDNAFMSRSEEHTSELQSREKLVCRLLREKKKMGKTKTTVTSTLLAKRSMHLVD